MEYIKKDPRIFEEQTFGYPNSTSCLYSTVYDTFDVMNTYYNNCYFNYYYVNIAKQILLNFKYLL